MKKRIICVLLTLIMLMSLVPVTASAAGRTVSESAITVLKQLQVYKSECYHVSGTEYRIGYGTICTRRGDHTSHTDIFTESDADTALRAKLAELDTAVNNFASGAGVTLTQGQHDALVVFSYDCGTAWMGGTGVLRSAVVNGLTGNAFLNVIGRSAAEGSSTDDAVSGWKRRMIEANMYLNGAYSNVVPSNYTYVTYDANGGAMAEGANGTYTQYYDTTTQVAPAVTPTKAGNYFLGWYAVDENGNNTYTVWSPYLTNYQSTNRTGLPLKAQWQSTSANYSNALSVDYWLGKGQLADTAIYSTPDTRKDATSKVENDSIRVDRDFIDKDGVRWSRLYNNGGWVQVGAPGSSASSKSSGDIDVIVTVTNSYVRSRANASIYSAQNGTYNKGAQLRIINTANGDGILWGQVANDAGEAIGWVALIYTNWDSVKNQTSTSTSTSTNVIATAVVDCPGYLNVRSEAGTDYAIVGALADGDHVNIYEIKMVNGHQWGRTASGWILLTYAQVTMISTDVDYTTTADALAYTFTGTIKEDSTSEITIAYRNDRRHHYPNYTVINGMYLYKDATSNSDTVGDPLEAGTLVAVTMLKLGDDGHVWGYNGTGWIDIDDIAMDVAKYVVVADSVTVREYAGSGETAVDKIVKGVELDIEKVTLLDGDATIWGYTSKYDGWVNLASKYVSRTNAPVIENASQDSHSTGLLATVINTDSLKVRNTGATYGKVIGSLSRGTTVSVWETGDGWYKVDSNKDGDYDYEEDGWVSAAYLNVYEGTLESNSTSSSSGSSASAAVETGLGIVANTYTGVNVRTGPGIGNAQVGKLLAGTTVEILEVTTTGTTKWGRVTQGWVCMDYITMVSYYSTATESNTSENTTNAGANAGGSTSNTEGDTVTVTTPAVYTGKIVNASVEVKKTADEDATIVRTLNVGDNVTIQELVSVTVKETVSSGDVVDGNVTTSTTTTVTNTYYWARVNDGWIADPETYISLNTLDETPYTVTGAATVNVRSTYSVSGNLVATLAKGTQVMITKLKIADDKVWGFIEDVGTEGGWVRLDNLSEGAITIKEESSTNNTTNNSNSASNSLVLGSTGNTATGGYVTNNSGYKYTGKVINTNSVNVRATPSTNGAITTTLKYGAALVVYETTIAENMAWGRCDAGWVYLYYVDLTPCIAGAVDARVVYHDNTIAYTDVNCSGVAGTYSRMSVVDIYEIVGKMARTELGWVSTDNLL